ncbi:MAG: YfiR family protein [Vicinamibacterales bacterium]
MAAQRPAAGEFEVKAAYLFNFSRFVTWPGAETPARSDFAICVLGRDPFGASLDSTLAGAMVRTRPVTARRIASAEDGVACEIVFVAASENARVGAVLAAFRRMPVLTVGDAPDFVERGGMVQFVVSQGRVRFRVNMAAAEEAGLALSADLLRVASAVDRARTGGVR